MYEIFQASKVPGLPPSLPGILISSAPASVATVLLAPANSGIHNVYVFSTGTTQELYIRFSVSEKCQQCRFNVAGMDCYWQRSTDGVDVVLRLEHHQTPGVAAMFRYHYAPMLDGMSRIGVLWLGSEWMPGSTAFEQVVVSIVTVLEIFRIEEEARLGRLG